LQASSSALVQLQAHVYKSIIDQCLTIDLLHFNLINSFMICDQVDSWRYKFDMSKCTMYSSVTYMCNRAKVKYIN